MVKLQLPLKSIAFKSLFLSLSLTVLSGCSNFGGSVDRFGQSIVSLGDDLQSMSGNVRAEKLDDQTYNLTEFYHEPVTTFDSWSMRAKAKSLCSEGYVYLSRNATKAGAFPEHHMQCLVDQSCDYALEWRVQCKQVPYEPFSLFGKT